MSSFSFGRTTISPFKRILNRKQIFRHHRSNHSSSANKTVEEELRGQDPYNRIRFESPLFMFGYGVQSGRLNAAKTVFPNAQWMIPYLIPFWQVHLLCDQKSSLQYEAPNGMIESGPKQRYFSDIGMAMAAVPKDHWASGMFVPWNIRLSAAKLETIFRKSNGFEFLPSQSPSIYTTKYNGLIDPFLSSHWDPNTAPRFAYGPPDLMGKEERIIMTQANEEDVYYEAMVPYGIRVYAIPVYRLMYKVGLGKRGVGVMDALSPENNYFRHNWEPGQLRPVTDQLQSKIGHHQRRMTGFGELEESKVINAAFHPPDKIKTLVESLFDAMWKRGPITSSMWENDRILPEFGPHEDGNAQILNDYNENCLMGFPTGPEPRFPIKKVETAAKTTLFNPRTSRSTNKNKNSESDSNENDKEENPSSSSSPSSLTSRNFGGQNRIKRRQTHYTEQAGIRYNNVKKTMKLTVEDEYIINLPTFLPDPKSYYKILNISEPVKDYLRLDKRDYIDDLISDQRNLKSFLVHPDRGGSHDKMTQLNEAFANLETLEKRRKYYADSKLGFRSKRSSN